MIAPPGSKSYLREFGYWSTILGSLCVIVTGTPASAADPGCEKFQHVTRMPEGFRWAGNEVFPSLEGAKGLIDIEIYRDGNCYCATRLPEVYHADFPDTPKDATLTCLTAEKYNEFFHVEAK